MENRPLTAVDPPRYLVSFHPKRILHRFTDALIVGSGLAGLRAAMEIDPPLQATLVTKDDVKQSNSQYAQGGIAAVWDPQDCFESHFDDTVRAGKGLCDHKVVDLVVREAPLRVRELIEWGAAFDEVDGELALGREGGHSFNRIVHALGDATGQELVRVALDKARRRSNLQMFENTFVIDLLTVDGRCAGALTWSPAAGAQAIWARQTILASGGCGQLFRETTNPAVATGDGFAVAYRAGAELMDMEFVQFHPTVLYVAGSARTLISEAARGEGARLRDRAGHRFMPDYDPRAELAPRDTVARAIVAPMAKTRHPCVYLDLSALDADRVRRRFPGITAACAKLGLDFARDPIPVRPGAHYMVGGVRTDDAGQTSIPGLWACGEIACTGLHGANRLASNSLLEALVFGARCGKGCENARAFLERGYEAEPLENRFERTAGQELDLVDVRNSLRSLMFRDAGIERDGASLRAAIESVDFWAHYVLNQEFADPSGWELQNMLTIAGVILRSALEREESRGVHYRVDFPETDDADWRRRLVIRGGPWRITSI